MVASWDVSNSRSGTKSLQGARFDGSGSRITQSQKGGDIRFKCQVLSREMKEARGDTENEGPKRRKEQLRIYKRPLVEVKQHLCHAQNEIRNIFHSPLPSVFALTEMRPPTTVRVVVEANYASNRLAQEMCSVKAATRNVAQRHAQR